MNFRDFGYDAKRFNDHTKRWRLDDDDDIFEEPWLKNNPNLMAFKQVANGSMNDSIKKGEKEMFMNYKDLDNIKVCYNGRLYSPSSVEVTDDIEKVSPRFRLEFYPFEVYCTGTCPKSTITPNQPKIEKVIFNGPATIVFWDDKTKTIVKSNVDTYDPEKGLVMAIAKKFLGNKGNYYNTIRKCLENAEYYYDEDSPKMDSSVIASLLATFLGGR